MHKHVPKALHYYADKFNHVDFILNDPIQIPKQFTKKQDIEIMAFWIAMLSWGNRKTIINKGYELIRLFDAEPYNFVLTASQDEYAKFTNFVQRTFNYTDSLYFLQFFKSWYSDYESLESAFLTKQEYFENLCTTLETFHANFFSLDLVPTRTRKHVSRPSSGSRCKRLLMFLRWMVRADDKGVDFGLWNKIPMSALMIPLDVHVERMARKLGLLQRNILDWKAVVELSMNCKAIYPEDPAKFDFALFGMSLALKKGDKEIEELLRITS